MSTAPTSATQYGETNFEQKYRGEVQPWDYDRRAVEILRHEYVVALARSLKPGGYANILDMGCSLGQLTTRLYGLGAQVHGIDLSATAVEKCRQNCATTVQQMQAQAGGAPKTQFTLHVGSVAQLPFADNSFDLVLLADGLEGWELPWDVKQATLLEVHRVLQPGGYAILTDYLKPQRFASFIELVKSSPLSYVRYEYMNDRLCYQFITWLKAVQHTRWAQNLIENKSLARALKSVSALFGAKGSKHLLQIASK